jgi:hypothetical protein
MAETDQHGAARRDAARQGRLAAGRALSGRTLGPAPGWRLVRQVARDERASTNPAVDVALGAQLLERPSRIASRIPK